MCRWLAYSGTPIFLSRLLFEPEHSLIVQNLRVNHDILVLSEPLDDVDENWQLVDSASVMTVTAGEISAEAFAPASA